MHTLYTSLTLRASSLLMSILPHTAFAQTVYSGGGIRSGIDKAAEAGVGKDLTLREFIGDVVDTALTYVALLSVAVIVIAGFYLILGLGSDDSREKAKKIVFYTAIGLLLIILSKVLINLVISVAGASTTTT